MNKPVYLGLTILEISRIILYKFWCDYAERKHKKAKLFYIDTDSFNFYIKTKDIYVEIAKMLKQDLILQTTNWKDHYLGQKVKSFLDY